MRGRDVEREQFHQLREAWGLAFRKVQDQASQGRRVDDRVLERALQASTDEPRVERVVAVLHEHRAVRETKKRAAGVAKLWCSNQH